VKPLPILQIINLVFGIFFFAWEWPLGFIAGTALHRSIEARLVLLPLTALASALLYQATNPAIYYTIGMGVYFWAYSEGEVRPLTLYCSWNKALTVYLDCGSKAMEPSSSHPPWESLDSLPAFPQVCCITHRAAIDAPLSATWQAWDAIHTITYIHLGGGDELELH
jgi:hypothetical protein